MNANPHTEMIAAMTSRSTDVLETLVMIETLAQLTTIDMPSVVKSPPIPPQPL